MLGPLSDRIWLHTGGRLTSEIPDLARLAGGVVFGGALSGPLADSIHASDVPVVFEHRLPAESSSQSERVSGPKTLHLVKPPSESELWLNRQVNLDLPLVTSPTCYLSKPETKSTSADRLREAIRRVNQFMGLAERRCPDRPRMALLALDHRWLRSSKTRSLLMDHFQDVQGGIGLMIGHRNDPLDDVRVIEGLIAVVTSRSGVGVLRSDHGALGALAMGAAGGSIGFGTGCRHFVPPGERGFANIEDSTARLLVPAIWAWWRGSTFDLVSGDDPLYHCQCGVCEGRSLLRFRDERLNVEANRHTVQTWTAVARQLQDRTSGDRERYWLNLCRRVISNLAELEDRHGIAHPPSLQLAAWCEFAGIRV